MWAFRSFPLTSRLYIEIRQAAHNATSSVWTSAINSAAVAKLKAKLLNDEHAIESAASTAKDKGKATVKKGSDKFFESAATSTTNLPTHSGNAHLDPDEVQAARSPFFAFANSVMWQFHDAKHALKKAVAEHYR